MEAQYLEILQRDDLDLLLTETVSDKSMISKHHPRVKNLRVTDYLSNQTMPPQMFLHYSTKPFPDP
jgi:hypothetical protein